MYDLLSNSLTGANKINVRQISEGDTQYHFKDESKYLVSKVIQETKDKALKKVSKIFRNKTKNGYIYCLNM